MFQQVYAGVIARTTIIGAFGLLGVLSLALALQTIGNNPPCQLCLLEKIGCLCVVVGFLMNMRCGLRPSHYVMIMASAFLTSCIAIPQIASHIVYADVASDASALYALILHACIYLMCMAVIVYAGIMLIDNKLYQRTVILTSVNQTSVRLLFILFTAIAVIQLLADLNIT